MDGSDRPGGVLAAMKPLEHLIALTAAGDRMAFRRLYEATSSQLYGIIRRMVRNKERSDDILQDVYLKIWRHAERFDPAKAPAMVWLITIARRVAIDDLRRVVAPTTSIDEDEALTDSLSAETQEQDPLAHDRLELCLGRLREEYRTTIMMAYVNGYTYEQLASRLDRPVGTLKTWVRRGLLDLRSCME